MDLSRFKECSATFGAERRRWPQREQGLFDRFADTPEGMAILAEAGLTDDFLDRFVANPPDPRRVRSIAALAMPARWSFAKPAAALAASAVLGFIVGYLQAHAAADAGAVAQLLLGPQNLQEFGL